MSEARDSLLSFRRRSRKRYLCAYCNGYVRESDADAARDSWGCHCHGSCLFKATGVIYLRMRRFAWLRIAVLKARAAWHG